MVVVGLVTLDICETRHKPAAKVATKDHSAGQSLYAWIFRLLIIVILALARVAPKVQAASIEEAHRTDFREAVSIELAKIHGLHRAWDAGLSIPDTARKATDLRIERLSEVLAFLPTEQNLDADATALDADESALPWLGSQTTTYSMIVSRQVQLSNEQLIQEWIGHWTQVGWQLVIMLVPYLIYGKASNIMKDTDSEEPPQLELFEIRRRA